jgi:uncharacterized protein YjiS (DUF1127 family)
MGQSISFPDYVEGEAVAVGSIVIRDGDRPAVFRIGAAGNDASCEHAPGIAVEAALRTQHTLKPTPDGFVATTGDVALDWPASYALHQAARMRRAQALEAFVFHAMRRMRRFLRRAWERHRRHRDTRAIFNALSVLDDRALHDLGFHRSEILSVAAEVTGEADRTRVRAPLTPRAPS